MIDKFNFYDIYGYFLPGAAFLAILWTPFGLVTRKWPSTDWTSAIITVAIAYLLGHIIQSIAAYVIRVEISGRLPSSIYLDPHDSTLPTPIKRAIANLVAKQFHLNLESANGAVLEIFAERTDTYVDPSSQRQTTVYTEFQERTEGNATKTTDIENIRDNAFRLARQMLIQGKAVSYAEQYQGMYALTSGLAFVLVLGCSYWLGWAAATWRTELLCNIGIIAVASSTLALLVLSSVLLWISKQEQRNIKMRVLYTALLLVSLLGIGYLVGIQYQATEKQDALLLLFAALGVMACLRLYAAFRYFAELYAATIWRDYLAYNVKPSDGDKAGDQPEKKK